MSKEASELVEQAIHFAQTANGYDSAGQMNDAIENYQKAIDLFVKASKVETHPVVSAMIKEKLVGYNLRVTTLNQILKTGEKVSAPIPMGLNKKGQKYKPPSEVKHPLKAKKTWE